MPGPRHDALPESDHAFPLDCDHCHHRRRLNWRRRFGLAVVAVLTAAAPLRAQSSAVRGRVISAETGAPLADAEITLAGAARRTRSDALGRFELSRLEVGTVELEVRRLGFAPARRSLTLAAEEIREVEVRLAPAALLLDSLVVMGPRDLRGVAVPPAILVAVDSVEILAGRTSSLDEPLRMIPGVQAVSRDGSDDVSLSIRGSGARIPLAVRGVGVLLDGVPLSEADGAARLDLIDLASTRRVEVVRGPASALYAGASGGIVNVVTRGGAESPGLTLRGQRGEWDFEKYDGSIGLPLAGQGGARLSGSYNRADGYRAHSEARTLKGSATIDVPTGSGTRLTAEVSGATLDAHLPGGLTQAEYDESPYAASPLALQYRFGRTDDRYRAGVRAARDVRGSGLASLYAYYGGRRFDVAAPGAALRANFHRVQVGGRVRSFLASGSAVELTLGFDYDRFFGDDRRVANNPPQPATLLAHGYLSVPNAGLYGQAAWRVAPRVDLVAGVRYDRVAYGSHDVLGVGDPQRRTDTQLSPKLTIGWRPGPHSSLYLTAARGFEPLAFGEVQGAPGLPFVTDQHPKRLWNYEAGGRTVVANLLLLDVAVYYQAIHNDFVPASSGGEPVFESASRARSIGAELGASAGVSQWLEMAAAYTFSDYRFREFRSFVPGATGAPEEQDYGGNLLPGLPSHRVTMELRLHSRERLSGSVQLEWQGRMFVENGNQDVGALYALGPGGLVAVPFRAVPSHTLLHLHAAWQVGVASIFGSVENLVNEQYAGTVIINDTDGRFYGTGSPRWLALGASLSLQRAAR